MVSVFDAIGSIFVALQFLGIDFSGVIAEENTDFRSLVVQKFPQVVAYANHDTLSASSLRPKMLSSR